MRTKAGVFVLSVMCSALFAAGAIAADSIGEPGRAAGQKNPLKNVNFGEEHLHTSASPDAFVIGGTNTWEDAYNWAMGKEITLPHTGEKIQRQTAPLDRVEQQQP